MYTERRREEEREGEKHRCERETSIGCLSYVPQLQAEPATQESSWWPFSPCGRVPNQLSHTYQGGPQILIPVLLTSSWVRRN